MRPDRASIVSSYTIIKGALIEETYAVFRGWDFERIKAGDRVTCIGNPSATGRAEMYMWSIVLADGTEFGR